MNIVDLIKRAWNVGSAANLDGIWRVYKKIPAPDYYHFLYGLCRVTNARNILEIGTDYGGAIAAMRLAVGDRGGSLVTVDPTSNSDEQLEKYQDIKRSWEIHCNPKSSARCADRSRNISTCNS